MASFPVEFVNPFFVAIQKICGETLKFPVTAGAPRLCREDERLWKLFAVSVSIQLSGAVQGLVSLSLSEPVAMAFASSLAMETFNKMDENARDAIGEVANLMIGSAKAELPGGLVKISTPQLTATHQVKYPQATPVLVLPFEAPPGRFVLQVALRKAA